MISIEEALHRITSQEVEGKSQNLPLSQCLNYHLTDPVIAPIDLPSFDNSAMDGYAVRGKGPGFNIMGEIQAGDIKNYELKAGQAFRIFTGAKIPENCEAVVMQEKTKSDGDTLIIEEQIGPGKNIRRKGDQVKKGEMVFDKGQKINPSVIGLLTSFGYTEASVFSKPRICLITTGNELIKPGQPLKEGQLYEANSSTLQSTLELMGFASHHQHVKDDFESTKATIKHELENTDILLISGGISVGDYDFVKKALELNGVTEVFYKVFQKPGKPLYFGRKASTFVFGLPGNPASSLVCLYVYVVPLLRKIMGASASEPDWLYIPMATDFKMPFDRPSFLKAEISSSGVRILEGQGSSMLLSMAKGNALALAEPEMDLKAGDFIRCLLIN